MDEEVLALFIPIIISIGLFTAISLNIYFRYKTNTVMSERVPLDTLGEWYRSEAQAKAARSRGSAMRWGGFFAGLGLGTAIGCIVIACGGLESLAGKNNFDAVAIAVFLVMSLAIFCGGAGMIGAYFLERALDKKSK
jgi:hypothetical protein